MMTTHLPAHQSATRLARDVLGVFKLRIGALIMVTALAGLMATPGPTPTAAELLALAASVLLASASAGAFNQYFEHDSDRKMARTRRRAFVTGALPRTWAWLVFIAALLVGAVALAAHQLNAVAAAYVFLGAFFYAVVYTVWLKPRTSLNIVIGGLAGSFAVLAGAATVDPTPGAIPWLLALALFLWTPPHFWSLAIAHRDDYAAAGVPMLPVLVGAPRAARIVFASTLALAGVSLLPVFYGAGTVYLVAALAGSLFFVARAFQLARKPGRATAMRSFRASLVQLSLLLAGASAGGLLR